MKDVKIFQDIVHSVCVCVRTCVCVEGRAREGRALKMGLNFHRLVEGGFDPLPSYNMIKCFLL